MELINSFIKWFPVFIVESVEQLIILFFCLLTLYYVYFRLFWIHIVFNLYSFLFKNSLYDEAKKSNITDSSTRFLFGFSIIILVLACKYLSEKIN